MSRCTPKTSGWNRRTLRYGGRAQIAAIRARQFQRLASIAGNPDGPPTTPAESEARDYLAFLEGNPVRVLTRTTEKALGWHDEVFQPPQGSFR